MDSSEKKKTIEYFNFWHMQNKMTLFALVAILILSALFVVASLTLPVIRPIQLIAFIIVIPTLACFAIATCYSSNLESAKAQREFKRLIKRLSETESSQITLDRFFLISSDLMAVAGKDGLLKKVSASLVKTLGYSEEVLLSTPFFEFIHPDDHEPTRRNIESLNLGIRSVGFENRYRTADGSYRTLSWSAAVDSELGVRVASARDVTAERNFQIYIRQVMDSAPFLLIIKDEKGTITSCNAAFARAVGASRESLLGQNAKDFMSGDKEQEVLRSQCPLTFDEVLSNQGVEVKYLSTIFPIFDQMGKIVSIGKISLNIESNRQL
ncbi:MAG: PAS domain-containing protein [Bacillota bacterium]